jgi:hypothetical protein
MSLPKKEFRVWLDHDTAVAVSAICETTEGLRPTEWMADVISDIVGKRVHAANVVVSALQASGAMRKFAEEDDKSL